MNSDSLAYFFKGPKTPLFVDHVAMTSRCSIGGQNCRRGAGRSECSAEGGAAKPCMEGKIEWGFYHDLPSLKLTVRTRKWMVGIRISFWDGPFSGAMLVSGRVYILCKVSILWTIWSLQGNPLKTVEITHFFSLFELWSTYILLKMFKLLFFGGSWRHIVLNIPESKNMFGVMFLSFTSIDNTIYPYISLA